MAREYNVYLEHESRHNLDGTRDHIHIERIEVVVEAPDGEEAVRRAREPLAQPERWRVRCIMLGE
jgi:hypothetical protein